MCVIHIFSLCRSVKLCNYVFNKLVFSLFDSKMWLKVLTPLYKLSYILIMMLMVMIMAMMITLETNPATIQHLRWSQFWQQLKTFSCQLLSEDDIYEFHLRYNRFSGFNSVYSLLVFTYHLLPQKNVMLNFYQNSVRIMLLLWNVCIASSVSQGCALNAKRFQLKKVNEKKITLCIWEFAKSHAFHAYVPYVPTCFLSQITTCLRAYMPSFFTCLRAYIPTYTFCQQY